MKSNPERPGGSLTSKPTWSNTSGCATTSAFFIFDGVSRSRLLRGLREGTPMEEVEATTGTMVQVFLLARDVPADSWSGSGLEDHSQKTEVLPC